MYRVIVPRGTIIQKATDKGILLSRLQIVQNRAARIVTFTKKYERITPSLMALHWLPVDYRIIYNILVLVYKAIDGFSPSYISNLLSFYSSSYSLRSCSNKLLQVPISNLKWPDWRIIRPDGSSVEKDHPSSINTEGLWDELSVCRATENSSWLLVTRCSFCG